MASKKKKKKPAAKKAKKTAAKKRAAPKKKKPAAKKRAAPKKRAVPTKKKAAAEPSMSDTLKASAIDLSSEENLRSRHAPVDDLTSSGDELVDIFQRYDRDRTGYIERNEFARLLEALGQQPEEEELAVALDMVDSMRTGKVSFQDFKRWWTAR